MNIKQFFGYGLFILELILFLWGIVKVADGWNHLDGQGGDGKMKIIAGIGMAISPFIMYYIFQKLGMQGAAIDPTTVSGF